MRFITAFLMIPALWLAACGQPARMDGQPGKSTPLPAQMPPASSFVGLNQDQAACRNALGRLGERPALIPGKDGPGQCGYAWAVSRPYAAQNLRWLVEAPATSCSVAAALAWWERSVVRPAAQKHLGEPVSAIRHMGSYGCRTIGNRAGGRVSEHGTANAIDIGGFRTASGREISLLKHWHGGTEREKAFLRAVHMGACPLFGTVLGPDYNAAHADHLHFDQMPRRTSFCR